MIKMDKKIIFGKLNFNYIYILLYIIIIAINLEIDILDFTEETEFGENYYLVYKILYLYINNFSKLLVIIPILIRMKNANKKNVNNKIDVSNLNKIKQSHESSNLIYNGINDTEISKRKKIFLFYSFLTSIFSFLAEFIGILFYIIYNDIDNKFEFEPYIFSHSVPFDSILQFISSHFILKIYFYKLQYFALSINIIIFIIFLIFFIFNFFITYRCFWKKGNFIWFYIYLCINGFHRIFYFHFYNNIIFNYINC